MDWTATKRTSSISSLAGPPVPSGAYDDNVMIYRGE